MKVEYRLKDSAYTSTAYVDIREGAEVRVDKPYPAVNKHTDLPLEVLWTGEFWVETGCGHAWGPVNVYVGSWRCARCGTEALA